MSAEPAIGPDCRDNKHHACDGRALDVEADEVVVCDCCANSHACDLGICAANAGHSRTCEQASGWADQ